MVPVQQYFDQGHMHKIEEAMRRYECTEANPGEVASDVLDSPITRIEINKALRSLKNHKAPGPDGIPAEFLKEGIAEIEPIMLSVLNAIFEKGEYPKKWAEGLINPIYKNGDPSDPDNYRKITILNSTSKVLKTIINDRITFKNEMIAHIRQASRKTLEPPTIYLFYTRKYSSRNQEKHPSTPALWT